MWGSFCCVFNVFLCWSVSSLNISEMDIWYIDDQSRQTESARASRSWPRRWTQTGRLESWGSKRGREKPESLKQYNLTGNAIWYLAWPHLKTALGRVVASRYAPFAPIHVLCSINCWRWRKTIISITTRGAGVIVAAGVQSRLLSYTYLLSLWNYCDRIEIWNIERQLDLWPLPLAFRLSV